MVHVLGEEEDGWWRGKLGDKVGLFPSNFVEVINEEAPPTDSAPLTNPREIPDGPHQQLPERRESFPPDLTLRFLSHKKISVSVLLVFVYCVSAHIMYITCICYWRVKQAHDLYGNLNVDFL